MVKQVPHNINGCVTWPKLVTFLLALTILSFSANAFLIAQHANGTHNGSVSDKEFRATVKRIDEKLTRIELDTREIKKEVKAK